MNNIEVKFPKLNHFWFDSGLIGMEVMLNENEAKIEKLVDESGIKIIGEINEIEDVLTKIYDTLVQRYYNLSTQKQIEDVTKYNFFYDSNKDKFIRFPKKKAVGIAEIIYNKAPRPTVNAIRWKRKEKKLFIVKGKTIKKNRGILPEKYKFLQERLDNFLDKHELDVTTSNLLVDGPNAVRPKIVMNLKPRNIKGTCSICGLNSDSLADINQTTFPFITGSSGVLSFNTQGKKPQQVCWKCSFIGKFVPVNGFYNSKAENLFAFFPYSNSFDKMKDIYKILQDAKYNDPNLYKNFKHPLGYKNSEDGYFQKIFELTFAFLYTLYKKILFIGNVGEKGVFDWEKMCDLTVSRSPLELIVFHAISKGNTYMGKEIYNFRDSVYFFRLIKYIEDNNIDIKAFMNLLIDFKQPNESKTSARNKICERILKKQSILDLLESHIFNINYNYIKPLFEFIIKYEPIIRKEVGGMTIDEQNAAVLLGKRIGITVGNNKGKKGDLYSLRKARKKIDFLNELNRLQFKCNLIIPPDLYEGKLTDLNFLEFKHFCMIAAMNSFLAVNKQNKGEKK